VLRWPVGESRPLVIFAFDHNGYLCSNSNKWIGDSTNAVLVDSFLQNLSYSFAYASGLIAYHAELMHKEMRKMVWIQRRMLEVKLILLLMGLRKMFLYLLVSPPTPYSGPVEV
jgi:hypothetical protein